MQSLKKLCLLAFCVASANSASESMAQDYRVLPVSTLGAPADADCRSLNYNGTVVCRERTHLAWGFEDRVTFDNPLSRPAVGRSAPTITGFALNESVIPLKVNMASMAAGFVDQPIGDRPLLVANGININLINTPTSPVLPGIGFNVTGLNDQGWMVLGRTNGTQYESYLRVPSGSDFAQGADYPITCPGEQPSAASKVNRNGLIGGVCNIDGNGRPMVWGWWALNQPVNLYPFLPTMVDIGSGSLIPRTESTYYSCVVVDMADRGDVLLVTCNGLYPTQQGSFVVSNSGSRQLPLLGAQNAYFIHWDSVNAQGCATGSITAPSAVINCSGTNTLDLSQASGQVIVNTQDINDQGYILAYAQSPSRPVVLVPR